MFSFIVRNTMSMEIQSVYAELVTELREWAQGEFLPEHHTLLVLVPKDCEISEIEETLETVKSLGHVRVSGRRFNTKLDRLTVLCDSREKIDPTKILSEVKHPTTEDSWPVIIVPESSASSRDAQIPLKVILDSSTSSGSAESIIRTVGDVLLKLEKLSNENTSCRHLRMFTSTLPTPAAEEALEHWLELARLMVVESDCFERQKRRRIMESLRGPALAVMKAVRTAEADITPSG